MNRTLCVSLLSFLPLVLPVHQLAFGIHQSEVETPQPGVKTPPLASRASQFPQRKPQLAERPSQSASTTFQSGLKKNPYANVLSIVQNPSTSPKVNPYANVSNINQRPACQMDEEKFEIPNKLDDDALFEGTLAASKNYEDSLLVNLDRDVIRPMQVDDFIVLYDIMLKQELTDDKVQRLQSIFLNNWQSTYFVIHPAIRARMNCTWPQLVNDYNKKFSSKQNPLIEENDGICFFGGDQFYFDRFLNVAQFHNKIYIKNYKWRRVDFKKILLLATEPDKRIQIEFGANQLEFPLVLSQFTCSNCSEADVLAGIFKVCGFDTTHLDLSNNLCNAEMLKILSLKLFNLQHLETLRLSNINLDAGNNANIFAVIASLEYLRTLDLSNNSIGDSFLEFLHANGCNVKLPKLRTLILQNTRLSKAALEKYYSVWSYFSNLKYLDISRNGLDDAADILLRDNQYFPRLFHLQVDAACKKNRRLNSGNLVIEVEPPASSGDKFYRRKESWFEEFVINQNSKLMKENLMKEICVKNIKDYWEKIPQERAQKRINQQMQSPNINQSAARCSIQNSEQVCLLGQRQPLNFEVWSFNNSELNAFRELPFSMKAYRRTVQEKRTIIEHIQTDEAMKNIDHAALTLKYYHPHTFASEMIHFFPQMLTEIALTMIRITEPFLKMFVAICNTVGMGIAHIKIGCFTRIEDLSAFLNAIQSIRMLKTLELEFTFESGMLKTNSLRLNNVKTLVIDRFNCCTSESVDILDSILKQFPDINTLVIKSNVNHLLFDGIEKTNPKIQKLCLKNYNAIKSDPLLSLISTLKLKRLAIATKEYKESYNPSKLRAFIPSFVGTFKYLQSLELNQFIHLCAFPDGMTELKELKITNSSVAPLHSFKVSSKCRNLRSFHLFVSTAICPYLIRENPFEFLEPLHFTVEFESPFSFSIEEFFKIFVLLSLTRMETNYGFKDDIFPTIHRMRPNIYEFGVTNRKEYNESALLRASLRIQEWVFGGKWTLWILIPVLVVCLTITGWSLFRLTT